MANKDYYKILGVDKSATDAEIKRAYRKKAMEWHPDKHKGDKKAEEEFKKINEAYEVLKDSSKRKQYDNFGSAGGNFSGQGFGGFEDIFGNFGGAQSRYSSQSFDFSDLFGDIMGGGRQKKSSGDPFAGFGGFQGGQKQDTKKEAPSLDVEKTYEVPIIDLILGTKLEVETAYSEHLKLKIPEGTKPGTRFKIKEKGRKSDGKVGDMYVTVDAKMPKNIPDDMKSLLEAIKYGL